MNGTITRKNFLYAAGAAAIAPSLAAVKEKPLWTAGLMTDTHIGGSEGSCARVKAACELFRDLGVDLVANCGDIAEVYTERGYKLLRRIYDRTFKEKKPLEIWVYANHEHEGRKDRPFETVMEDVRRHLGIPHGLYASIDFKGYPLLVFPQWLDVARAEKMLKEASEKYPGKPIFVFDHPPAKGTTENSLTWGAGDRYALLAKFPRTVQFSGHVHGSLRSERQIWQKEFTAVNLGCLSYWGGESVGAAPADKQVYCVAVMEVYTDRLTIRRFDVRDRSEHRAETPWIVPLPFDPASAPYRVEAASAREPVPEFSSDAGITLVPDANPAGSVKVSFPCASGADGVYKYKIEVLDDKGSLVTRQDCFGSFWMHPRDRPAEMEFILSAAYFDPGRRHTVSVTPMNCFGACGKPLTGRITLDAVGGTTVWETADPAGTCRFRRWLKGGENKKPVDGWFEMHPNDNRLELPKGVWDGPAGTRFRFTVDLGTETFTERPWTVVLRNPEPMKNANARIYIAPGKMPRHRIVIEFEKKKAEYDYYLLVREGGAGRIRFDRIRIEKL